MLKIYQVTDKSDAKLAFVEKVMKDDEVLSQFDEEKGEIDLKVLEPYNGEEIQHYHDGVYLCTCKIDGFFEGEDGFVVNLSDPVFPVEE
jgi:hypothetical protein